MDYKNMIIVQSPFDCQIKKGGVYEPLFYFIYLFWNKKRIFLHLLQKRDQCQVIFLMSNKNIHKFWESKKGGVNEPLFYLFIFYFFICLNEYFYIYYKHMVKCQVPFLLSSRNIPFFITMRRKSREFMNFCFLKEYFFMHIRICMHSWGMSHECKYVNV